MDKDQSMGPLGLISGCTAQYWRWVGEEYLSLCESFYNRSHFPTSQRAETRVAMAFRLASWVALVAGFAATCSAQKPLNLPDPRIADAPLAKAFCASPGFKQLTCGFASPAEESATLKEQCARCGTLFRSLPSPLPAEVTGRDTYNQFGVRVMSLACKGPVVVRSVFKILTQPTITNEPGYDGTNCTNARLETAFELTDANIRPAPPVVRCELQLPSTGGSETERALSSKEVRCWNCGYCDDGKGCPANNNTWYSDSFTSVATGCDFNPQKGYNMHRVGFNINPFTKILLAKFEVCNSPSCFDPKVEKAKLAAAKPCAKGKCEA